MRIDCSVEGGLRLSLQTDGLISHKQLSELAAKNPEHPVILSCREIMNEAGKKIAVEFAKLPVPRI